MRGNRGSETRHLVVIGSKFPRPEGTPGAPHSCWACALWRGSYLRQNHLNPPKADRFPSFLFLRARWFVGASRDLQQSLQFSTEGGPLTSPLVAPRSTRPSGRLIRIPSTRGSGGRVPYAQRRLVWQNLFPSPRSLPICNSARVLLAYSGLGPPIHYTPRIGGASQRDFPIPPSLISFFGIFSWKP